jgi:hypothetical protein
MGEKTIGFVEKAFDFTRQNLHLLPAYFSADEFGIDCGGDADALAIASRPMTVRAYLEVESPVKISRVVRIVVFRRIRPVRALSVIADCRYGSRSIFFTGL